MRADEIGDGIKSVRPAVGASRRTKNYVGGDGVVLRFNRKRDAVLVADRNGLPLAWIPIDEVEVG